MTSPLPPQTTRTGFPGTINTLQTKLWGPAVTPSIPLPLIQSRNSILCPLEALCTAQASSPSSPAPACLFPLPQLGQCEAGTGSAVGGHWGEPRCPSSGAPPLTSTHQSRPQAAPHCSIVPLAPHPRGLLQPNPIMAKSGKLSPWNGKARFHGFVPKGLWVPLASWERRPEYLMDSVGYRLP